MLFHVMIGVRAIRNYSPNYSVAKICQKNINPNCESLGRGLEAVEKDNLANTNQLWRVMMKAWKAVFRENCWHLADSKPRSWADALANNENLTMY
ncbi:unnamed protein product [Ceratitis capitata]|uniref:(Mediterranean fruit fly) hypothetical protein n=1 Tax=Ceratitis capitata TaxID=7213 RepID=A0A811U3N7_CERCA|nr:unnamed protein product [Ceratitis capitata]